MAVIHTFFDCKSKKDKQYVCRTCNRPVKAHNTGNLTQHLKTHAESYAQFEKAKKNPNKSSSDQPLFPVQRTAATSDVRNKMCNSFQSEINPNYLNQVVSDIEICDDTNEDTTITLRSGNGETDQDDIRIMDDAGREPSAAIQSNTQATVQIPSSQVRLNCKSGQSGSTPKGPLNRMIQRCKYFSGNYLIYLHSAL